MRRIKAKRAARETRELPTVRPNHPLRALSTPQLQALQHWINHYRHAWKQELSEAWLYAGARAAYYTPELQQIRNGGGNTLLKETTFADVEALLTERRSISSAHAPVSSNADGESTADVELHGSTQLR